MKSFNHVVHYCRIKVVQFTTEQLTFSLYTLYTFLLRLRKFPKWWIFLCWILCQWWKCCHLCI